MFASNPVVRLTAGASFIVALSAASSVSNPFNVTPFAGSAIGYSLYNSFNTTARAAHFVFLPFASPTAEELAESNITLSALQEVTEQRVAAL
ncbi:hypothetical protein C8R45DRAFT_1104133 [Mycena sanguinolenta]|nr:hypothetical protein C8R45DRAFT_1104133 [Mycena sanguinolenta]